MKILLDVKGSQTQTHCSNGFSVKNCEWLHERNEKCLMFKKKLEYDSDNKAFNRCKDCLNAAQIKNTTENSIVNDNTKYSVGIDPCKSEMDTLNIDTLNNQDKLLKQSHDLITHIWKSAIEKEKISDEELRLIEELDKKITDYFEK